MAIENVVIAYTTDISDIKRKVQALSNINKKLGKKLGKDFSNGFKVISDQIDKISTKKITLKGGKKATRTIAEFSTVLKNAQGKLFTFREKGIIQANGSVKKFGASIKAGGKNTRSFGDNLKTLASRALLTIPVWFALRSSISGVFRTIRDGLTNLAEFDRALQKLKRNLDATSNISDAGFKKIQNTITEFSLKTGKSVEEITNAIQKFATVGFDLETSLAGGLTSTKLAITLFGDVEGTAQAFARSLRVLTEDLDTSEEKSRAIAEALAITDQLWQTNAFEIDEFSQNLTKFAGVAKIANLSIEDTLTLLATLSTGGLANRAGRLLRSTLLKSLQDIEKVTDVLQLDFNPETQPTIEFILALVKSLKNLRVAENVPVELAGVLGELFTVRGTEVISALVALEKTLKENIALTPDLEKFNDTFENQLVQINRLVDRHKNLNKEMSKAFVTGLLGAGNYQKALQGLVGVQEKLIDDTNRLGASIRNTFAVAGVTSIVLATAKLRTFLALLTATTANPILVVVSFAVLGGQILTQVEQLAKEAIKGDKAFNKIGEKFAEQINKGIKGKLDLRSLQTLVSVLENAGAGDNFGFEIPEGSFNSLLKTLKEILEVERAITKEAEELTEQNQKDNLARKKQLEIAEIVLENELELLRARGASESQIIKATQAIREQLGLEAEDLQLLKEKLAIERANTEEKRLQNNQISDQSQKLAEIVRTEGTPIAKRIGDVLSGELDFDLFERIGGRAFEVFKRDFNDVFQQRKDIQTLAKKGFRVPLELADQITVRGDTGRIRTRATIQQARAEAFVKSLESNAIDINANTLAIKDNTISLENLICNFQQGQLINTPGNAQKVADFFTNNPQVLNPQLVQPFTTQSINAFPASKSLLEIIVKVDGIERTFSGSPEAIRKLAERVSVEVAQAVEEKLVNDLNTNDNAPISQATDGRTLKI